MDLSVLDGHLAAGWRAVLGWWDSGSIWPMAVWLLGLAVLGWVALLAGHALVQAWRGHYRVGGTWISPAALEALLDRLQQRERDGTVSLSAAEVNLLDRFRPDRRLHLKRLGEEDYVAW